MASSMLGNRTQRRKAALREVLNAAWALVEREGVAALSRRELARTLGMRPESLAHYFPTKAVLLDALFRDGFSDLADRLQPSGGNDAPADALIAAVRAVLAFCVASPARYHLMLQRTVPGFTPTQESHQVALTALSRLLDRLPAARGGRPAGAARVRGRGDWVRRGPRAHHP